MKRKFTFFLLAALVFSVCNTYADTEIEKKKQSVNSSVLRGLVRKDISKWLPVVKLNMRTAFHSTIAEGAEPEKTNFKFDYMRLEVDGNLTNWISYKWCQHLNKSNARNNMDQMPSSIDCLGLNFQLTPTLSTFVGKQYSDFGGFEYDANPAEEYFFTDYGSHITCFLVGADVKWQVCPEHQLRFQVVNGHNTDADGMYKKLPDGVSKAEAPLGYTFNWNGSFFDNRLTTRSSASVFHQAEKENMFVTAVGLQWKDKGFRIFTDFWYSTEDIDKLGLVSETVGAGEAVRNSENYSALVRMDARVCPKFNIFAKGAYETFGIRKAYGDIEAGEYRTSYSYCGGIEYFPLYENLRIFAMYHGQKVEFSEKTSFGKIDLNPQRFSFGVVYRIPVL